MTVISASGVAAFLVCAAAAFVWLFRSRSARRLNAAADAYADREMGRSRLDSASEKRGPFRTAADASPKHRAF